MTTEYPSPYDPTTLAARLYEEYKRLSKEKEEMREMLGSRPEPLGKMDLGRLKEQEGRQMIPNRELKVRAPNKTQNLELNEYPDEYYEDERDWYDIPDEMPPDPVLEMDLGSLGDK